MVKTASPDCFVVVLIEKCYGNKELKVVVGTGEGCKVKGGVLEDERKSSMSVE